MGRPTIVRQHSKFVLYDIEDGYHVELGEKDLARLIHEASGLLYIARLCDGAVPVRTSQEQVCVCGVSTADTRSRPVLPDAA